MSLINEALKKAQRQRSLEAAPLSSAPSGVAAAAVTTHVRAASHKRSLAPLWFGLGVLALGAGSTALVMRYGLDHGATDSAAASAAVPKREAAAPVYPAQASPMASVISSVPPAADAPVIVLPQLSGIAPASTPDSPPRPTAAPVRPETPPAAPAATLALQAPEPASSPASSSPVAAPISAMTAPGAQAAPVAPVTKVSPVAHTSSRGAEDQEAGIQAFLNGARITGVRGGDKDARLLMNERVWRPGDTVSPELGLRLQAVRSGRIVFADAQGKTYEKAY